MRITQVLYSVWNNKCPRCHQETVFEKANPYNLKFMFRMKPVCAHCEERYEKEPGYFYGAMYVSYALTSLFFIILFLLDIFFFHLGTQLLFILIPGILLISPITFRWSRLIWLNMFIKYNPALDNKL
ncbi:MAG: DUF983 domain-containing protein [Bacteroidia bacterium]|nr:DUF983 domain-containing protein [Bacteroidia bacterium]